jgi:hypothetical protein
MQTASPHYDREALMHEAVDDTNEFRVLYEQSKRAGFLDSHLKQLADEHDRRVKAEKDRAEHLAATARRLTGCKGVSCRQGRQPCTEGCHEVDTRGLPASAPAVVELGPIREMACYEPADEQPQGWLMRVIRWLKG